VSLSECVCVCVYALCSVFAVRQVFASAGAPVRKKRHWVLPPKNLTENKDYTKQPYIAKIRSDFDDGTNMVYSLEGVGANREPFHTFVVIPETGYIRVTRILDREKIDTYHLSGVAHFRNQTLAEKNIDIRIKVVDENDNDPVFGKMAPADVLELSPAGTTVMKVNATDADEKGTKNSQIAYSIVEQRPNNDMFLMRTDGTICVKKPVLDREVAEDRYVLVVKGQDLNGQAGGRSGTGTVTINVRDVNDNVPTLEKEQYDGTIDENVKGVEVMRIKAQDLDLEGTENWDAVFDIVKGNEAGYFSITTDPKTNEGVLMLLTSLLVQAVDYEDVKNLDLGLTVRNKAPYKTYPINIKVKNQPEGPRFDPKVKAIPVSEGGASINFQDVIAKYPAIDGDTLKPAENVRYAKGLDPDSWLTIDPKTAEIRLNKMPDRESPFLVNGTYFAQVLCISEDMPGKTATGTVAIQVEDLNDHCPTLTSSFRNLCTSDNAVVVNAADQDGEPNGPPFEFTLVPGGTEGKWQVEHLNDTAAILRAQETLWPGPYRVEFLVKDQQGEFCPEPQKVTVVVCTCEDGVNCGKRGAQGQVTKSSSLGPAGIGLLLLGLLLLLLAPLLLLFCRCGGAAGFPDLFTEMPFDTKSHLINYHTERQGENTVRGAGCQPFPFDLKGAPSLSGMNVGAYQEGVSGGYREGFWEMNQRSGGGGGGSAFYSDFQSGGGGGIFDGMALPDHFLQQYYDQELAVKDGMLVYDFEGRGSPAGSVSCSSLLESRDDLHFLDDLGPKFKTLAEVCGGQKTPEEPRAPPPQPPPPQPAVTRVERSTVRGSTELSTVRGSTELSAVRGSTERSESVTRSGGAAVRTQSVVLPQQQQPPIYYAAPPAVVQPMHYVVQPQVQSTLLLAQAPPTNLVLVQDAPAGPPHGSQTMMVVEGRVPSGSVKVLKGGLVQGGALQSGGLIQGGTIVQGGTLQSGGLIHGGALQSGGLIQGGTLQSGGLIQGGTLQSGGLIQGGTLQSGGLIQGGTLQSGGLIQGGTLQSGGLIQGGTLQSGGLIQGGTLQSGGLIQGGTLSGPQRMVVMESSSSSSGGGSGGGGGGGMNPGGGSQTRKTTRTTRTSSTLTSAPR
uniref:Cadherin domain-containing protein n=1 Tax=Salarias fasciatus TaxID=181472 RepID=A0A672FN50_SALFA